MNLARVSINGQITVPIDIRNLLGLKAGDKVLFVENDRGDVILTNASNIALAKAQTAFQGAADELGIKNEEDVQKLVNEVRYGQKD